MIRVAMIDLVINMVMVVVMVVIHGWHGLLDDKNLIRCRRATGSQIDALFGVEANADAALGGNLLGVPLSLNCDARQSITCV